MPAIMDNGVIWRVEKTVVDMLERAGMVTPCQCEETCDGPFVAYHPAPGKTLSDARFHLNEMRSE